MDIVVLTTITAGLFILIALAEPLAARLSLPYSVILAAFGILIGAAALFLLRTDLTDALNPVAESILALPIRSNVFLYVFLPTLLFQATLGMNLRRMLDDWVPIMVLAVVAVVVATLSVGYALSWATTLPLAACLLIGAIVSTTDPSAVVSIFRSISAPRRLARIIEGGWFRPRAVVGFWPANAVGDDIHLFTGEDRSEVLARFHTLRQQVTKRKGRPNVALSDFVAPEGHRDYLGAFVVTAGPEEQEISARYERANDDYGAIMVKALADRIAEAMAEMLHERVRRELWGYAPDEAHAPQDLIAEPYAGIRPAPGYPAQPDHTEKDTLFRLLDAETATGVTLTESMAMWPGSSVSGLYIGHPEAYYFGVAKIEQDQARDYADRKGMSLAEVAGPWPLPECPPPGTGNQDI